MSDISVVIPVYNRESLLPMTLRSLLQQTVPADEIIVVDDGSTDGTAEVASSFGGPVRVLRQKNSGPASARNLGFRECRGKYIHFFDSDDIALPNKHEVQLRALEENEADIAYGPWVKGVFDGSEFTETNLVLQQKGLPRGDLVKALLSNWSIVPHACMFRRAIVEKSGGFPKELWVGEDQIMFLNCLLAGAKVVHSPGTLELYRSDHEGQVSDTRCDSGRRRHLLNWAHCLLMAEERCKSERIDPTEWFGFRRRIWKVLRELAQGDLLDDDLKEKLRALAGGRFPALLYQLSLTGERIRQGVEARLGRGRAHPCFQVGEMDKEQRAGLKVWQKAEAHFSG